MSFFQNIFKSKLNTVTFVILPVVIILLIMIWIALSYFGSNSSSEVGFNKVNQQSSSIVLDQTLPSTIVINSNKSSGTKASFDDLEKPNSTVKPAISSVIALASPIASTPEIDATEILSLLEKVEQYSDNDDAALDNQILEN